MNDESRPSKATGPVLAISIVLLGFLFWLIYFKTPAQSDAGWISQLPTVIACLNAAAAGCLLIGFVAIKRGSKNIHITMMVSATISSALFLVFYIIRYHYAGDTKFLAEGIIRPIYFFVLISHILLSMVAVPLILMTLWFAIRRQFERHRRIAKWTFPIWMYISVTGILVYLILTNFNTS